MASLRALVIRIVADAFPALAYGYPRTYVVQAVRADGRLDLSPLPDAVGLPELPAVEPWTLGGAAVTPSPGAEVVIAFRDADPTRPVVVGYAQAPAAGGTSPLASLPSALRLDAFALVEVGPSASAVELAGGGDGVARVGDCAGQLLWDALSMQLYYSPSAATSVPPVPYAPILPNPSSPAPPALGTPGTPILVATGSGKVTSG